jgi:HAMP domain-containing protein
MNLPEGDSVSVAPIKGIAGKNVYEIALPLEGGVGAAHVGMNAGAKTTVAPTKSSNGFSGVKVVVLAGMLLTLVVTAVASLLIAKRVNAPIANLAEVVKNICDGKLSPKIEAASEGGDLGRLARAIERLQAKLEVKIEE